VISLSKQCFVFVALIALISLIGCTIQQTTTTTTARERERVRETTTTTNQGTQQSNKDTYLQFEDRFFEIEQSALNAIDDLANVLDRLANRNATIDEAISSAERVRQESQIASNDYNNLTVPSSLPSNVQGILEQATSSASSSYSELALAMDALIAFLQAPAGSSEESRARQEFQNRLNSAVGLRNAAIDSLNSARRSLGLPKLSTGKANMKFLSMHKLIAELSQLQKSMRKK